MSKGQSLHPLKITFDIDAAGLIYDPYCPPMLDGLIDWALSPMVRKQGDAAPMRGDMPQEINLPLGRWRIGQYWGYHASAIMPADGITPRETIVHFRKKFRLSRISMISGNPNLQAGPTREYNLPYAVQIPGEGVIDAEEHPILGQMVAYCLGDRHTIDSLLRRNVRYLGQKKHRGYGRVENITVEKIDTDCSLVCGGKAMRWLPDANGLRAVRLRPPYWNNNDKVNCCEVGDEYKARIF